MKQLCNFLFLIRLVSGSLLALLPLPLLFLLLSSFAYAESSGTPQSGERVESVIYPGDGTTEAEPEPPPSFSLNLAPAIEAKLPNTLSADELKRLRPRPDFTPLGVHRVLHDRVRLVEFGRNGRMIDRTQALTRQAEREAAGLITEPAQQQQINGLQNSNSNNKASSRDSNNKASTKDAATDRPNLRLPSPRSQAVPPHNVYSLVEGAWQTTAAGSLWRMQITAPAARALRLHFKDFNVGAGRVWIYASSKNSLKQKAYGPYTARGIYDDGDFWSDIVFHNSLTIEYSPDPDRPHAKAVPFRIHKVSHLTRLPFGDTASRHDPRSTSSTASYRGGGAADDTHRLEAFDRDGSLYSGAANSAYGGTLYDGNAYDHGGMSQSQAERTAYSYGGMLSEMAASLVDIPQRNVLACHLNARCYYPEWEKQSGGVAFVFIERNGGSGSACSGNLLNDKVDGSYIPYFLTAAHCVKTDAEARSVIIQWNYVTAGCYNLSNLISSDRTRGARLLETMDGGDCPGSKICPAQGGDVSLLKLSRPPPAGVWFLGWSSYSPAANSSVTTLHHPVGDIDWMEEERPFHDYPFQRITFGRLRTSQEQRYYHVVYQARGLIETASSGAPLFNANKRVIGTLSYAATASCSGNPQRTGYSKFSVFYPLIRKYLDPNTPTPIRPTVTLTASSYSIQSGQSVTLSWSSTRAERVRRKCSDSSLTYSVQKNGSWTTSRFTADTTCRITAASSTGHTATDSVRIRVVSVPEPKILSFTASPSSISAGERVTLRWSTRNAQTVSLKCSDSSLTYSLQKNGSWTTSRFTADTTCRITAASSTGHTATDSVRIRVVSVPEPKILSFTASPSSISAGERVTLRWSTRNAQTVSLKCSDSSLTYSLQKNDWWATSRFTTPTTCRITATSSTGRTATDSVRIHVESSPEPKILSFTASPSSILSGERVTLRWSTRNAQTVTSNCDNHPAVGFRFTNSNVNSGSWSTAALTQSTTCRLTATGANGHTDIKSVDIHVRTPDVEPKIIFFRASSTSIARGANVTLTWSTRNAHTARIDPGIGKVFTTHARTSVSPQNTTTYRLTATGANGQTDTRAITITVRDAGPIPTINLSAHPSSIQRGENTTLRWSTTNADRVFLGNSHEAFVRSIAASGSKIVRPLISTTYTIEVVDASERRVKKSVHVQVHGIVRPIINLTASSYSLQRGQGVNLNWSSTNAKTVSIRPANTTGHTLDGNGDVISGLQWNFLDLYGNGQPSSGSYTVYPTASVTYLATAISPTGHTARDSVRVIVNGSSTPDRTNDNDDDDDDGHGHGNGNGNDDDNGNNESNRDPATGLLVKISASPKVVKRGGCTLLGWRSENAASLYVDGLGGVSSTGVREECNLQRTTTFRITATHSSGVRVSSSVRVVVTD